MDLKIHKLDVNASNENILIRYLPERYIWENINEQYGNRIRR